MRLTSIPVLAAGIAAALSSSALWQAFGAQTMPTQTALVRFGVCLAVSWAALALVKEMALPNLGGSSATDPIDSIRKSLDLDDLGGYLGSDPDLSDHLSDHLSDPRDGHDGRADAPAEGEFGERPASAQTSAQTGAAYSDADEVGHRSRSAT